VVHWGGPWTGGQCFVHHHKYIKGRNATFPILKIQRYNTMIDRR